MNRLGTLIFIMAFATITGAIVVAMLTMNMTEPMYFIVAAGAGLVLAVIASILIARNIRA